MPVWHAATQELRASGALTVIGIVQEQHPDRARLFAQWQGFDWPILWDAFNLLDLSAVPIVCAVDEHGEVRSTRYRPHEINDPRGLRQGFVERTYTAPIHIPEPELLLHQGLVKDARGMQPGSPLAVLNALSFFVYESRAGGDLGARFDHGVDQLRLWAERDSALPQDRFRLGVALRLRYDSPYARPDDFQASLDAWSQALAANPSQYIWRRRIQQWGPRLDKPYPFYDWVARATSEIAARGEVPIPIEVTLTGSELAGSPAKGDPAGQAVEPDPQAEIPLDESGWLRITSAVALHSGGVGAGAGKAAAAARVHLALTLNEQADIHWTNDAGPSVVWIDPPAGWSLSDRSFVLPAESDETSQETRRIDFGVMPGSKTSAEDATLRGYVLAYLCSGADGECRYLRREFEVVIAAPGR